MTKQIKRSRTDETSALVTRDELVRLLLGDQYIVDANQQVYVVTNQGTRGEVQGLVQLLVVQSVRTELEDDPKPPSSRWEDLGGWKDA